MTTNGTEHGLDQGAGGSVPPVAAIPSYAETKAAEKTAADKARLDALDPVERRRQELSSPDGIYSKDPAKAKATMDEMRKLLASAATQDEKDAFANLPIGTLRDAHGVTAPDLPSHLKGQWSNEREAEGLIAMQEHGVSSDVVQQLHGWYVQRGISNMGQFGEEDVVAFREYASKRGLSSEFIEQLIEWHNGAS
jgi:hypothetical protein